MRRTFFLFGLTLLLSAGLLHADDQTRDVQTQLKSQGFYFGEIDGQGGASTVSAIKRFQIRNGLEVTGEINPQTLQALGIGDSAAAPAPAPAQVAPPPAEYAPQTPPPLNLRREESVADSDRRALRQETEKERRPVQPPAPGDGPANQPSARYRDVFTGTPYATAPRVVQEETFLRAQHILADRGLLPSADGAPGPATEEAILGYQRSLRIPASGRLDLETLNSLRLLPGRGNGNPGMVAPRGPGAVPGAGPGPNRVARPQPYKGIWVQ